MKHLELVKPTLLLEKEYWEMIKDWKKQGEKPSPWTIALEEENLSHIINRLEEYEKGIGLESHHVEHSTYWLVENHRLIGAVNIRHRLNDYFLKYDGHIGGGIRPSERKKGYATKMLELAIEKARQHGINPILVTCDKGNKGSEKTLIKCGGIEDTETITDSGFVIRRFWFHK